MTSFTRTTRRAVLISCVAGAAVVGAVGLGAAAYADGMPTPGTTQSATTESGGPAAAPDQAKHEPHIGGTVLTVSGSTVTVQDREGFTRTVHLADGVKVTKDDASSSVAAITKGAHVEASGAVASDRTTLNATTVHVGEPTPPKGGLPGPGGPGATKGAPTPPSGAPVPPSGAPTAKSGAATAPSGAPAAPSGAATAPSGAPAAPSGAATAPSGAATAPSGAPAAPSGAATTAPTAANAS